jgi:hypothetical protein
MRDALMVLIGVVAAFALPRVYEYAFQPPKPLSTFPTVEAFVTWYVTPANTAQSEDYAKREYYGKYVQWEGMVGFIQVISGVPRIHWTAQTKVEINGERKEKNPDSTPSYHSSIISASFKNKEDIDTLSMPTNEGKKIVILCKLSSVHLGFPSMMVMLDKCQLIN